MKRQTLIIISNRKKNNDKIKLEIFINPTEVRPHSAHLRFSFAAEKQLCYDDTEIEILFKTMREEADFCYFCNDLENSDGYCGSVERNRQFFETGTTTGSANIGVLCLVFQYLVAFGDALST